MDPLSLTVGCIALLGAIKKTGDGLKLLLKLSKDAEELLDETFELRCVLEHIKSELSRSKDDASSAPPSMQHLLLGAIVQKANLLLRDILALIKIDSQAVITTKSPAPRADWHISRKKVLQVHKLRERLSDIKPNITIALILTTSMRAYSLEEAMSNLSQELKDGFEKSQADRVDQLPDLSVLLSEVHAGTRLLPITTRTGEFIVLGGAQTNKPARDIGIAGDVVEHIKLETPPAYDEKRVTAYNEKRVTTYGRGHSHFRPRRNSCNKGCPCSCHRKYILRTANAFHQIAGGISVAVIPPRSISGRCNELKCRRRSAPMAHIECILPRWLMLAILSLTITSTSPYAFNIDLRARRLVPNNAPIFLFATQGDLRGIRRLFEEGLASPHDVDSAGTSALVYAMDRGTYLDIIDRRYIELWRYLLEKGADPYLETDKQHCPMDVACGRILGELTSKENVQALSEDLEIDDYLEQKSLPILHRILLGLVSKDLRAHLEESTAMINERDYQGRTAVSWAALRGDRAALDILLQYGADPNVVALNGDAPLHYATRAKSPHCIAPLIKYGADVNALNAWNCTPLSLAGMNRDDVIYMQPLLDAGAQINIRDGQGRSTLVRCISLNRINLVRYLIDNGASVLETDAWFNHPLKIALELKGPEIASIVFEAGKKDLTRKQTAKLMDLALERGHIEMADSLQKLELEREHRYTIPGAWECFGADTE